MFEESIQVLLSQRTVIRAEIKKLQKSAQEIDERSDAVQRQIADMQVRIEEIDAAIKTLKGDTRWLEKSL